MWYVQGLGFSVCSFTLHYLPPNSSDIQGRSEGQILTVLFGMHSVDSVIMRLVKFSAKC